MRIHLRFVSFYVPALPYVNRSGGKLVANEILGNICSLIFSSVMVILSHQSHFKLVLVICSIADCLLC